MFFSMAIHNLARSFDAIVRTFRCERATRVSFKLSKCKIIVGGAPERLYLEFVATSVDAQATHLVDIAHLGWGCHRCRWIA